MEKKEISKIIGKDVSTLYNWEKKNPILYKIVYNHFNKQDLDDKTKELIELFKNLNEIEKEFYLSDIKARVLKKQLEK